MRTKRDVLLAVAGALTFGSLLFGSLLFASLLFGSTAASAQQANAELVVDSTGDQDDADGADGQCLSTAGTCTLRAAISQANYNRGPDTIRFNIAGGGIHRIDLDSALPTIQDPSGGVLIDGYSQPGAAPNTDPLLFDADIRIEVEGRSTVNAFTITSAGNEIRGLSVFASKINIELLNEAADGNIIVGNIIGTDAAAQFERSGAIGVAMNLGPDRNAIGRPDPADRNVISGNGNLGIRVNHGETSQNVIQNNIVGLDPTAERDLAQNIGIDIQWWTWGNLVGGDGPGEGNLIGGNDNGGGVDLSHMATGNIVLGNRIGTTADGRSATAETGNRHGVIVKDDPRRNYFANNIISGNDRNGIWHKHNYTTGNFFVNNKVGIGVGGEAVGNREWGIYLTGHDDVYHGNLVANNDLGAVNINNDSLRTASNWPDEQTERNAVRVGGFYNNGGSLLDIEPIAHPSQVQPTLTGVGPGEVYGSGTCPGCEVDLYVSGTVNGDGTINPGAATGTGLVLLAQHSALCVEVAGGSTANLAAVVQNPCDGDANQRFELIPTGSNFLLKATHSGRCLDVRSASTGNGADVIQYDCHGSANQQLAWSGSNLVFAHSGKCFGVDNGSNNSGENLEQNSCGTGEHQRFGPDGAMPMVWIGTVAADGAGSFSLASPLLQPGAQVAATSITPDGESSEFSGQLQVGDGGFNLGTGAGPSLPAPGAPPQPDLPPPYQPELFTCSESGGTLSWDDAGAAEYYVFSTIDGVDTYLGGHTGTTLAVAGADSYRVTHWRDGFAKTATCAGPGPDTGQPFTCSVSSGVLSWTDAGAPEYYVFATTDGADSYLGAHSSVSLAVSPADEYRVTHWLTGQATRATCDGPGGGGEPFTCSVADGVLSWTDAGASDYYVFATTGGADTYLGAHTGTSLAVDPADEYRVTHWLTGQATRATCAGPGGAVFSCSVSAGTLSWDDAGAPEYYVFSTTGGVDTYLGGHSGTSLAVSPADEYRVTHWLTGQATRATC